MTAPSYARLPWVYLSGVGFAGRLPAPARPKSYSLRRVARQSIVRKTPAWFCSLASRPRSSPSVLSAGDTMPARPTERALSGIPVAGSIRASGWHGAGRCEAHSRRVDL